MSHLVVASHFVWSHYPGLRAGRLYAGKPDVFRRPSGESHLVATPDAAETLCGRSRALFPHDFGDPDSLEADRSTRCTECGTRERRDRRAGCPKSGDLPRRRPITEDEAGEGRAHPTRAVRLDHGGGYRASTRSPLVVSRTCQ